MPRQDVLTREEADARRAAPGHRHHHVLEDGSLVRYKAVNVGEERPAAALHHPVQVISQDDDEVWWRSS